VTWVARREVDRGSATVLAAVGAAGMLVVLAVGIQIAGATIARHRAEAAADLAALAGATEVRNGREAACGRAGRIASANGASVQNCEILDLDLRVTVRIVVSIGPIGASATGRGRAGPMSQW
jgi:secretion/DNA translocation related TadE-like protein